MRDPAEKTINGHVYRVSMMAPVPAEDMLEDIVVMLLPSLGGAAAGVRGIASLAQIASLDVDLGEAISTALPQVAKNFDKVKLAAMRAALAEQTLVDGAPLKANYDRQFAGNLSEMWQWFSFALLAQYSDFFVGPNALVPRLLGRLSAFASAPQPAGTPPLSVSPSPITSAGPSGA